MIQVESIQYFFLNLIWIIVETFEIVLNDTNTTYALILLKIWLQNYTFTSEVMKKKMLLDVKQECWPKCWHLDLHQSYKNCGFLSVIYNIYSMDTLTAF